jgi:hypothetical protein
MFFVKEAAVLLAVTSLGAALVSTPNFAGEAARLRNLQRNQPEITERDDVPAGYVASPYYPAPPGGWSSSKYMGKISFKFLAQILLTMMDKPKTKS